MRDFLGNEIKVGDRVIFSMGYRSDCNLYKGTVVKTDIDKITINSDQTNRLILRCSSPEIIVIKE